LTDTVYQAATDGYVIAYCTSGSGTFACYTDSSNPPTTVRATDTNTSGNASVTCPVKKNDYWKVTSASSVYWIPGGGESGFSGYSGMPGAYTASGFSGYSGYSGCSGATGLQGASGGGAMAIGTICDWTTITAPADFLMCDGTEYSQVTYSDLFDIIGTTYNTGGETPGYFRVPNIQGRVVVGLDGAQTEFDTLGETGGEKTHVLTMAELPDVSNGAGGQGFARHYANLTTWTGWISGYPGSPAVAGNTKADYINGSSTPHNNLQPYIVLYKIIKYQVTPILNIWDIKSLDLLEEFGGNGVDGALTISADTNFSAVDGATPGQGRYTTVTIDAGKTLTIDTKIAYIFCQGDCHIHGTISAYGGVYGANPGQYPIPGTLGNQNTNSGYYGKNSLGVVSASAVPYCWGGGGGSATGGAGGGAGGSSGAALDTSTADYKIQMAMLRDGLLGNLSLTIAAGGGGSSGTCHPAEGVNAGGGGVIYLEVGGDLYFDGVLEAKGTDGTYIPNGRSIGGGGGGVIIVRAASNSVSSGTTNVAGGAAGGSGYGGSSSPGAAGQAIIIVPNSIGL
jgi:microcystin-dependent protein